MIVGIDLGTTYSLVATLRDGEATIIPNALGQHLTPSAVGLTESEEIVVGAAALAQATTHPERTVLAWKRDMGTDRTWQLGRRRYTPQELSSLVLGSLKADAEKALGVAVDEAVVTVPAYFDETQRRATRDAAAIAGLRVDRIINEPTAAALAYGLHQRGRELRAVVLDLGGGTFDVTVLEIVDGVVEIQASAGDARLGGEDFSDAMAESVAGRIGIAAEVLRGRAVSWARLRAACEDAKRALSAADEARIVVPALDGGSRVVNVDQTVTRAEVERLWAPIIDRMRKPIGRALRDAQVQATNIDEVLLVGGATRTPCVVRAAAEIFQRMPSRSLPADEAVALGAAVQAALKEGNAAVDDLVVTDIAPFTLGIATASRFGQQHVAGVFSPIIERGTVIPASRVQSFSTVADNQREILIEVYQGEHATCEQNKKLGQYTLKGLPRGPAGSAEVEVRFSYDMNGLLEVEMILSQTGRKETLVIEQTPGRLTAAQIAASRRDMERLKFHPREALPNTTALARADSRYVELRGPLRDQLGHAIATFRAILDRQDPREIEAARAQLLAIIDSVG